MCSQPTTTFFPPLAVPLFGQDESIAMRRREDGMNSIIVIIISFLSVLHFNLNTS